ncbi:hypothetical protein A6D98_18930 [Aliivibrio fischeri]|uniref:hypothetical protein n=1 Tax=Aliivibrio fischeri TaxID=668 RepID=UPI00080EDB95|nr:hypothetical protein [Aliivibrio fischeri]OCH01420.1 hypothetical protein A6E10_19190 [Aliivibrio fischeri]OCH26002.1 hypothetical protein A6E13_20050 [Aliivibrio fischeri]OCH57687.1 hypothetical protein A6D98_18930 [Aliivibrio fischeri]
MDNLFVIKSIMIFVSWVLLIVIVIWKITLREKVEVSRNLISSGLYICLLTVISAVFIADQKSSFLLQINKSNEKSILRAEKIVANTDEDKVRKDWNKTVAGLNANSFLLEMDYYLSKITDTIYLIVTIIGSGLGGTFIGSGVLKKIKEPTDVINNESFRLPFIYSKGQKIKYSYKHVKKT